jgi:hypothetical protein
MAEDPWLPLTAVLTMPATLDPPRRLTRFG